MSKTITLEGVEYMLVPVGTKEKEELSVTFYYGCDSDCGFFHFHILLNDKGEIWEGAQSVTYYPDGQANKNNVEYWDDISFLRDVLRYESTHEYSENTNADIPQHQQQSLVNLLQKVHEKGWI